MDVLVECPLHSLTVSIGVSKWASAAADGILVALRAQRDGFRSRLFFDLNDPLARLFGGHLRPADQGSKKLPGRVADPARPVYEPADSFPEHLLTPSLSAYLSAGLAFDATLNALAIIHPPAQAAPGDVFPEWLASWASQRLSLRHDLEDHGKWRRGFYPSAVAVADGLYRLAVEAECESVAMAGTGLSGTDTADTLAGIRLFAESHPDRTLQVDLSRLSRGHVRSALKALSLLYVSYEPYLVWKRTTR